MKSSSEWTLRAFFALDTEGKGFLYKKDILTVLRDEGVLEHKGLQDFVSDLEKLEDDDRITLKHFLKMTMGLIFLRRVLERNLVIPMFETFVSNYKRAFLEIKEDPNQEGHVATYIPPLAKANPQWFSTSFCSTDDQQTQMGDTDILFSM